MKEFLNSLETQRRALQSVLQETVQRQLHDSTRGIWDSLNRQQTDSLQSVREALNALKLDRLLQFEFYQFTQLKEAANPLVLELRRISDRFVEQLRAEQVSQNA